MFKRARTMPATKGRPKTKSRTPAASRAKKSWDVEDMEATPPWCDETFFDEMSGGTRRKAHSGWICCPNLRSPC